MIIGWLLATASAGPVLQQVTDPLRRCIDAAASETDGIPFETQPLPRRADRVAVVVGVPCHRSDGIPSLAYSSRDAARVADVLQRAGYAVIRLVDLVDRSAFSDALDRAEATLSPGGTLVVYFSGHGVLREQAGRLRRYLVFSDTELGAVHTTGLPVLSLDDRISQIEAEIRVVIQDTCFAAHPGGKSLGLPGVHDGRSKGVGLPEPRLELLDGDIRLYASRFFELALESPEHRSSLYTHHLLAALEASEADLDGDGCVGLLEGHLWAQRQTHLERGGFQTPQGRFLQPHNPLLACTPKAPVRGVLQIPEDDSWRVEIRDRDGALVQRTGGAMPAGRYQIHVDRLEETEWGELTRTELLDAPLRVHAGEWIDLESELAARRTPLATVGLDAGWRSAGDLPSLSAGVSAWYAGAAHRLGRTALGLRGSLGAGPVQQDRCGIMRSTEVMGMIGQLWTTHDPGSTWGIGPILGTGVVLQSREHTCTNGVQKRTFPATTGTMALRTQWSLGDTIALSLEGGLHGMLVEDLGRTVIQSRPTLRVGVGPTL